LRAESISNDRLNFAAPDSGRNLLDLRCRNAYKSGPIRKGTQVRTFVSLILVSKRTAGGG
jgi:hypothetical protein